MKHGKFTLNLEGRNSARAIFPEFRSSKLGVCIKYKDKKKLFKEVL